MADNSQPETGLSTDDAAAAFAGLLTDDLIVDTGSPEETEALTPAERQPRQVARAPAQAEAEEGETETQETSPAEADAEEAEGAEKPAADEDTEEDAEQGAEPKFTVKVDGKDVEIPQTELIAGYQRQADYSRKTQALSEERRAFDGLRQEFEAKEKAPVLQERAQYKQLLGMLTERLEELSPQEPNWQELFARDKNEYLIARDNWRAITEQKAAAKAELDRVTASERAEYQKLRQNNVQAGHQKLVELNPAWKDEATKVKDFTALAAYAQKTLGYTTDELRNADDHRALFAVWKAMKYDELQAKAKDLRPTGVKSKTLPAGSASRQVVPQNKARNTAMNRLKQTGSVDDAAPLMSGFLDL
jgi:hypothetical protein